MALSSTERSVTQLTDNSLLDLAEAAEHRKVAPSYLRDCIKAKRNEAYRRKRRIPKETLRSLPLDGWQKRGNKWLIRKSDFLSQVA